MNKDEGEDRFKSNIYKRLSEIMATKNLRVCVIIIENEEGEIMFDHYGDYRYTEIIGLLELAKSDIADQCVEELE